MGFPLIKPDIYDLSLHWQAARKAGEPTEKIESAIMGEFIEREPSHGECAMVVKIAMELMQEDGEGAKRLLHVLTLYLQGQDPDPREDRPLDSDDDGPWSDSHG
jgi:hypothetical protein